MKHTVKLTMMTVMLALLSVAAFAGTTPQTMHISCEHPNPQQQDGLRRIKGDGDIWTFQIALDGDAHFVDGPNWHYPGKGGTEPDWGLWTEHTTSLDWSSPEKTGSFGVSVDGTISCGDGGGGEPIDFSAGWSGKVEFNAEIKVKRKRSGDDYSSSATVAAGGLSSDEHKADVEVIATDDDDNPIKGITIPAPTLQNGDGVKIDADITPSSATSDSSGKAYFTFTSSDIAGTSGQDVTLKEEDAENTATATVKQSWTKLANTEGNNPNDAWMYNYYFDIEVPSEVIFRMGLVSDGIIPIKKHSIHFVTTEIDGYKWIPGLNSYEPATLMESQISSGEYATLVTYSALDESPLGSYVTDQTIHSNSSFKVFGIGFKAVDNSVFVQAQ